MKVAVVGPSFRFMSGMSVYTCRLSNALAERHEVSVLLLDHLIPKRFYPGSARVGNKLAALDYDARVKHLGLVDWWGSGLARTIRELWRVRPAIVVLQWWTAATLHTFFVIAVAARLRGIRVVIEFHEVQDTGEARLPVVGRYARLFLPRLIALAVGSVIHHEHDRLELELSYGERTFSHLAFQTAPHGPYDHLSAGDGAGAIEGAFERKGDRRVTEVLSFGTIRPYKGLEDLIAGFNALPREQAEQLHLTVVGETWEGWTLPGDLIESSPHRDLITFVNRYVTDAEAAEYLAYADVMALPARRGSASGPLHIAMSSGLHVVMYAVPGLMAAAQGYGGLVAVPEGDRAELIAQLLALGPRRSERFVDPHSWDRTVAAFEVLAERITS